MNFCFNNNRPYTYTIITLILASYAVFAACSFAITEEDLERINQRAASVKNEVIRREALIVKLNEKLALANQAVLDAENTKPDSKKAVDASKRKVTKLTNQLTLQNEKLTAAKHKSEYFSALAKRKTSQYNLQIVTRKHNTRSNQLSRYTKKVKRLERKVRESRAEVTARKIIAGRSRGQWQRRVANFKVGNAQQTADYLLDQLRIYRDKVKKAEIDIVELKSKLEDAETDFSQYSSN